MQKQKHPGRAARGFRPKPGACDAAAVLGGAMIDQRFSSRRGPNRRDFLRTAAGLSLGTALMSSRPLLRAEALRRRRKVIVITFGGGARDQETFAPEGQENIPHLLHELIPQSSFFTQVVNRGILGHYVATASLATGVYETLNNFAAVPPEHPTVFEYFRKDLHRPANDTWVVAPSNGFNRIGESDCRSYGQGAAVVLPKRLLSAASAGAVDYAHLLQDNYETPLYTPDVEGGAFQMQQMETILKLSVGDFLASARTLASPDELSVFIAKRLMQVLAPSLLWITMHDMDIAHSGAYSLYIDGIQRTDRLCAEVWNTVQNEPEYAGNTTLLILPDFGRDGDQDSGGNGFQHHRTGDAGSRTTWMMAMGVGARAGVFYDDPVQSIDLVPTLGAMLGFSPVQSQGKAISHLL